MTALSIRNMNWTVGQRELEPTGETLSVSQLLTIRKEVLEVCIRNGLYKFSDELSDVIEQLCLLENITPEAQAVYFADPRTPEQIDADPRTPEKNVHPAWQKFADEREKAFNRRYYNNPDGEPVFKY